MVAEAATTLPTIRGVSVSPFLSVKKTISIIDLYFLFPLFHITPASSMVTKTRAQDSFAPTQSALPNADEKLGYAVYKYCKQSKVACLFSELMSMSGDEMVWFIAPAVIGSTLYAYRVLNALPDLLENGYAGATFPKPIRCAEEFVWDMFGAASASVMVESVLKAIFQRNRPTYAPGNCFSAGAASVPFEHLSFPSGHSMRVFYLIWWISNSAFVGRGSNSIQLTNPLNGLPWACLVGWSRVAKGRHFPADILAGAFFGGLLGYLVEVVFSQQQRAVMKTIGGFYITYFFGVMNIIPFATGHKARLSSKFTLFYFLFYVGLFFATLPPSWEKFGAQTLVADEQGVMQCESAWF